MKSTIDEKRRSAAASVLGKKGGATMTKKRLDAILRTGKAARGKAKHRRTRRELLAAKQKEIKKEENTEPIALSLRDAASVMGHLGGLSKSPLKVAAASENIRKKKRSSSPYTYKKKVKAKLGLRDPRVCVIPDQVADEPEKYKGRSFKAIWKRAKISVEIISVRNGRFHVQRFY
jgi:hypothetical protein